MGQIIELVIKIPEEEYDECIMQVKMIEQEGIYYESSNYTLKKYITNGTPLPKGHGRLGDLDELEKDIINGIRSGNYEEGYEQYGHINNMDDCVECVKFAPTVIEADKAENE